MGQIQKEKDDSINHSKTVCFKHSRYEVSESNGHVEITIEKKIEGEFTFWLKTFDGTAKAVEDYVEKNELMMMQADEWERQIKIEIKDDTNWEPDEVFTVQLLEEVTNKRLDGDDTKCEVMIIDEDKPGNLGFPKTNKKVRRKDKDVYIKIHRQNGSDGEISCLVRTVVDENVPGVKAIENKDFVPIKDQKLTFKMGEVEHTLKIEMPDCESVKDDDGEEVEADHIDTVSFAIMLHSPSPEGIKLSKRQVCYINIEADDDEAEKIAKQRHRQMLDYFMHEKTITWGQ